MRIEWVDMRENQNSIRSLTVNVWRRLLSFISRFKIENDKKSIFFKVLIDHNN